MDARSAFATGGRACRRTTEMSVLIAAAFGARSIRLARVRRSAAWNSRLTIGQPSRVAGSLNAIQLTFVALATFAFR